MENVEVSINTYASVSKEKKRSSMWKVD